MDNKDNKKKHFMTLQPKQIIVQALDLILSTSDGISPQSSNCALFFWIDNYGVFYFVSRENSEHVQNINKNSLVSVCIVNEKTRRYLF